MPTPIENTESSKTIDFIKNSKNLLNATSNISSGLGGVLEVLYGFLMSISSTNLWFTELRKELNSYDPTFLQKIKIAYIYYYVTYMKVTYHFKEDYMKDSDKAKFEFGSQRIQQFLKDKKSQYFFYLLNDSKTAEEYSPFKDTELAGAFLEGILKIHADLFKSEESSKDIKSATIEDFFKDLNTLSKENDHSQRLQGLSKWLQNADPAIQTITLLSVQIDTSKSTNAIVHIDLKDNQSQIGEWFQHIKDEKIKSLIFRFWEKYDGQKVTEDLFEKFNEDRSKLLTDIEEKKKPKQAENPKQEGVFIQSNIEDKLAMNMADYITGRISASEFQKRDQSIRNSNGSSQPLEEMEPAL